MSHFQLSIYAPFFFCLSVAGRKFLKKKNNQKSGIVIHYKLTQFILQVSPLMEAEELTNDVLGIKNIIPNKDDIWAAFEVLENGELG